MTYEWTDAEKRDVKPGTPLIWRHGGRASMFVLVAEPDADSCRVHRGGVAFTEEHLSWLRETGVTTTDIKWSELAPYAGPAAPPLSVQERELFESRCKELGQVRAKLEEMQRVHTAAAQTLSHMVHKDREKDERIAKLEAAPDGFVPVAALRELIRRVSVATDKNREGSVDGFGVRAELEDLCAKAETATRPAPKRAVDVSRLDESGEPAVGDYVAKSAGERAQVGDRVRCAAPGLTGEQVGKVLATSTASSRGAGHGRIEVEIEGMGGWYMTTDCILEILPEVSP